MTFVGFLMEFSLSSGVFLSGDELSFLLENSCNDALDSIHPFPLLGIVTAD